MPSTTPAAPRWPRIAGTMVYVRLTWQRLKVLAWPPVALAYCCAGLPLDPWRWPSRRTGP